MPVGGSPLLTATSRGSRIEETRSNSNAGALAGITCPAELQRAPQQDGKGHCRSGPVSPEVTSVRGSACSIRVKVVGWAARWPGQAPAFADVRTTAARHMPTASILTISGGAVMPVSGQGSFPPTPSVRREFQQTRHARFEKTGVRRRGSHPSCRRPDVQGYGSGTSSPPDCPRRARSPPARAVPAAPCPAIP